MKRVYLQSTEFDGEVNYAWDNPDPRGVVRSVRATRLTPGGGISIEFNNRENAYKVWDTLVTKDLLTGKPNPFFVNTYAFKWVMQKEITAKEALCIDSEAGEGRLLHISSVGHALIRRKLNGALKYLFGEKPMLPAALVELVAAKDTRGKAAEKQ